MGVFWKYRLGHWDSVDYGLWTMDWQDTIISYYHSGHFDISQSTVTRNAGPPTSPQVKMSRLDCVQNLFAKSVQISETLKLADITDRIWIFSFIIDTL